MRAPDRSKIRWPDGKHNTVPSSAVDVTPYPVVWDNRKRQFLFAGYALWHFILFDLLTWVTVNYFK